MRFPSLSLSVTHSNRLSTYGHSNTWQGTLVIVHGTSFMPRGSLSTIRHSNLLIESPWVNKTCLILTRWTFAHSNVTGWDASLCPHMRDKYLSTITWRHVTESTGLWRHLTETTGLTYLRARVTSMQARVTSMQVLTPLKRAYITSGRIACK